ncbi:MAG: hypothetical protein IKE69_10395 [Thermoguttaceae bacterium]|nr:hypothetical protein [Thermoguttaceae bacterium]
MKILNEIAGSTENRIVYEDEGKIAVLRRPSRVSLDEMRAELAARGETAEAVPESDAEPSRDTPDAVGARPDLRSRAKPHKGAARAGSGRS